MEEENEPQNELREILEKVWDGKMDTIGIRVDEVAEQIYDEFSSLAIGYGVGVGPGLSLAMQRLIRDWKKIPDRK